MRRLAIVTALVALVAAGCGGTDGGADESSTTDGSSNVTSAPADVDEGGVLRVVATTSILGDVVSEMAGDAVEVEVIIGPGIDPHDFQPSAAQAAQLREADLVVANGLGLEGGLVSMIEAAEDDGTPVIEVAELVDPIPFIDGHDDDHADDDHAEEGEDDHADDDHAEEGEDDHAEDDHAEEGDDDHVDVDHAEDGDDDHAEDDQGHDHGDEDPHFWQDPIRMADAVGLIAAALAEIDETRSEGDWQEAADAYAAQILEVHLANEELLSAVPPENRKMVTNHEAFGYFAYRYDFDIIGTVIPGGGTLAEPSAADLAGLIAEIREEGVGAIFVENTDASRLADVLASELGEQVGVYELISDSLTEPGTSGDSYLGMIATNAAIVAEALA